MKKGFFVLGIEVICYLMMVNGVAAGPRPHKVVRQIHHQKAAPPPAPTKPRIIQTIYLSGPDGCLQLTWKRATTQSSQVAFDRVVRMLAAQGWKKVANPEKRPRWHLIIKEQPGVTEIRCQENKKEFFIYQFSTSGQHWWACVYQVPSPASEKLARVLELIGYEK